VFLASDNVTLAIVLALPAGDRQTDDNDRPIGRSVTLFHASDTVARAGVLALLARDCQTDDSDTTSGAGDVHICGSDNATHTTVRPTLASDSDPHAGDTVSCREDFYAVAPRRPRKVSNSVQYLGHSTPANRLNSKTASTRAPTVFGLTRCVTTS
jgi:hypothetical protein